MEELQLIALDLKLGKTPVHKICANNLTSLAHLVDRNVSGNS